MFNFLLQYENIISIGVYTIKNTSMTNLITRANNFKIATKIKHILAPIDIIIFNPGIHWKSETHKYEVSSETSFKKSPIVYFLGNQSS